MKFKFGVKTIVLSVVALILVGVLIWGNIFLQEQAPLLHGFFGGIGGNTDSAEAQEALGSGDQIVQDIAEDSIVLLKNETVTRNGEEEPYLPLRISDYPDDEHGINLFGWGATDAGFLLVGGGSGGTPINESNPMHTTLTEAFTAQQFPYNKVLAEDYAEFSSFDADYRGQSGSTGANALESLQNPPASWYTSQRMEQAKATSEDAIVVLSRWGAENGNGAELKGIMAGGDFLRLMPEEKAMLDKLKEYNFNVTVLLNTTNPLELGFLEEYDNIKACLYIGIPGQSGAMAIPNILLGSKLTEEGEIQISPSGRLSDTYAYNWKNFSPSYNNVGIEGNIAYTEGIYVGYKWYETAGYKGADGQAQSFFEKNNTSYEEVVQFPFGYGQSYTTFTQTLTGIKYNGETAVSEGAELQKEGTYTATVHVKNTGSHAGKEVVQLYYSAPYTDGKIEKASINLLAFGKTKLLEENEETDVELTFTAYDMASYDDYDKNGNGFTGYELDNGQYDIKLMQNAHTPYEGQSLSFNLTNTIKFEKDPVTGADVKNLFTGDTAYANVPVDGSNGVTGGVTYLSRANNFANYEAGTKAVGSVTGAASSARGDDKGNNGYEYNGYETDEIRSQVSSYLYGANADLYIMGVGEDGAEIAPTLEQMADPNVQLKTQTWLLELLFSEDEGESAGYWEAFLNQLTQDEIKTLIGMSGFHTEAIESVGKPRNFDTDGPAGYNSSVASPGQTTGWTVFPAETLSGCSWNTDLMYQLGLVQGKIGTASGVQGWYAPGVNLHRSPYNSRNYEYYSEDGRLSGYMAAATIKGAKEENVYCYLKHFALAESGQNSNNWYEWITEQALRENYCKPFEIAVKEGGANAMMSAFNCVGAVWSGYNHALLTDMLRTEWGFKGSVITDWGQSYMGNYGRAIKAGNDLWLRSESSPADISFDGAGEEYAARQSAKGILYTYLDTLYTSGVQSQTGSAAPFSPLFASLWAIVDIVLILGTAACVLFAVWSPKKKKAPEGAPEAAEPAEAPAEAEEAPEPETSVPEPEAPAEAPDTASDGKDSE